MSAKSNPDDVWNDRVIYIHHSDGTVSWQTYVDGVLDLVGRKYNDIEECQRHGVNALIAARRAAGKDGPPLDG